MATPPSPLEMTSTFDERRLRRCRDRGIEVSLGDGFTLRPGREIRDFARDVAAMAELGAQRINTVTFEPDLNRSVEQFGVLSEMAAEAGMETTLEFSPGLAIADLPSAIDAIRAVGRPDFRLLIDTMHLVRSGSGSADIAALAPGLIGYVQLSDVPLVPTIRNYMEEACFERMVPGTGEAPLLRSSTRCRGALSSDWRCLFVRRLTLVSLLTNGFGGVWTPLESFWHNWMTSECSQPSKRTDSRPRGVVVDTELAVDSVAQQRGPGTPGVKRRRIGTLEVSVVGLGGNNFGTDFFGARCDEREVSRIVNAALDVGINLIDTAEEYSITSFLGVGHSEEFIGAALGSRRDEVVIATKFLNQNHEDPDQRGADRIVAAAEASLQRLGTDRIDLFQQHQPDPFTPMEEILEALDKLIPRWKSTRDWLQQFQGRDARQRRGGCRSSVIDALLFLSAAVQPPGTPVSGCARPAGQSTMPLASSPTFRSSTDSSLASTGSVSGLGRTPGSVQMPWSVTCFVRGHWLAANRCPTSGSKPLSSCRASPGNKATLCWSWRSRGSPTNRPSRRS